MMAPHIAPAHTARAMPRANPDDATDESLMLAYAAGDAGAFDTLFARHRGGLYRYLLRHVRIPATADELYQDVWTSVVKSRASYAPRAKFATWLYTLAHNRLVDHWRANGRATIVSLDEESDDGGHAIDAIAGSRVDEPETQVSAGQLRTRIKEALAALPAEQRDAFLLQYEGGLALAEIAAITGAGGETVKSRLRYATAKLRSLLEDLR
jgi:RNA polymerase sigma factor (sigma-70 family)